MCIRYDKATSNSTGLNVTGRSDLLTSEMPVWCGGYDELFVRLGDVGMTNPPRTVGPHTYGHYKRCRIYGPGSFSSLILLVVSFDL